MEMFLQMLLGALPTLVVDGEQLFNSLAHGEGGVAKVEAAGAALSTLAGHAATVAAAAKAEQPAA